jgi:RNA polymerase sigma-70 factor (ECF subfamily)
MSGATLQPVNRVNSGCTDATSGHSEWDRWLAEHGPKFLLFARQQTRFEVDGRRAIDLGRSEDRRAGREAAAARESTGDWFDAGLEERERNQLIQRAMKGLPEIYREVLTLKVWGDLTFAEPRSAKFLIYLPTRRLRGTDTHWRNCVN